MIYDYLANNPTMACIFIAIIILILAVFFVKHLQSMGLEAIRGEVYKAILKAEHNYQHGDNKQKFEYVVGLARSHLPVPFGMLVTESFLRSIVQTWFDLVKDLLDDGKINAKKGE